MFREGKGILTNIDGEKEKFAVEMAKRFLNEQTPKFLMGELTSREYSNSATNIISLLLKEVERSA